MVQNKLKPQINQMNTEFLIKTSHWRAGLNDFSDFFNHFNQINHCFLNKKSVLISVICGSKIILVIVV